MSEIYYCDNTKYTDILKWFIKTGDIEDIVEVSELMKYENVRCLLNDIKTKSVLIDIMNKTKESLKSIHYTIMEESSNPESIDKYRGMRNRMRKEYLEKGFIGDPEQQPEQQPKQYTDFTYNQQATYKQIKKFIKASPYHTNIIYETLTKYNFEVMDLDEPDKEFIGRVFKHLKKHSISLFISIDRMALCC